MSRGSLKKTIHLEKKLKLIPLPTSKQYNNSERRGIHNSFFTDEEFNQLKYFRFFFFFKSFLIKSQFLVDTPDLPMTTGFVVRKAWLLRKLYLSMTHQEKHYQNDLLKKRLLGVDLKQLFPKRNRNWCILKLSLLLKKECFSLVRVWNKC